ncbi:unnamed protein product, partial [Effrenium voratum]
SCPPASSEPTDSPAFNQVKLLEAEVADLRREVRTSQEQSFGQSEVLLNNLKRDLAEVQEKVRLQVQSSEEQRSLHQVISQSAGDLGRGIEELSSAMLNSEATLRQ